MCRVAVNAPCRGAQPHSARCGLLRRARRPPATESINPSESGATSDTDFSSCARLLACLEQQSRHAHNAIGDHPLHGRGDDRKPSAVLPRQMAITVRRKPGSEPEGERAIVTSSAHPHSVADPRPLGARAHFANGTFAREPEFHCFRPPQLAASSISRPLLRRSLSDHRDQLFDEHVAE
jgi:hypothetical protein